MAILAGHAIPILVPCMVFPNLWPAAITAFNFDHSHESYRGHALLPPGFNPEIRAGNGEFRQCVNVLNFHKLYWMEIFHEYFEQLTKLRSLRPSAMFSPPPVAPMSCDFKCCFDFARDCRHRTQIPSIF